MKEKLQKIINAIIKDKKKLAFTVIVLFGIIGVSFAVFGGKSNSSDVSDSSTVPQSGAEVAIVGSSTEGYTSLQNSWPGEIISLSNVQVQPARDGSIVEWYVHVGQRVSRGQIIAKLSQPSATPELIGMLADKSEALSATRAQVEATKKYTTERILQLQQMRDKIESNQSEKAILLGNTTSTSSSFSVVDVKKRAVRATLQSSVTKTFTMITGVKNIPSTNYYSSVQIRPSIGAINSSLRSSYIPVLSAVMADLNDTSKIPSQSGVAYFETAIKLTNASMPDGTDVTDTDLDNLKTALVDGQSAFISALNDEKMSELDITNNQKDSFSQLRDIDSQISGLEKDLATAEGEIQAKEVAYQTVNGAVNGGYSIIASRTGTISSILKKTGEFVSPGMPVAVIAGDDSNERIVRFRIPNNVRKPVVGEVLSITRPGFASDMYRAKIIGVGTSLDDTGSYMADATLLDQVDWPTGTSVRMTVPKDSSTVSINISSIWWDASSAPNVWKVSSAGRIFSQKVNLGRTLGTSVEVYEGLKNGESYIVNPTPDIQEDMLIDDIKKVEEETMPAKSGEHTGHEGMEGM